MFFEYSFDRNIFVSEYSLSSISGDWLSGQIVNVILPKPSLKIAVGY